MILTPDEIKAIVSQSSETQRRLAIFNRAEFMAKAGACPDGKTCPRHFNCRRCWREYLEREGE